MHNYRKISNIVLSFFLIYGFFSPYAQAQGNETVTVSVFVRDTCGHCQNEKEFLQNLDIPGINIETNYYNLSEENNRKLFDKITDQYGLVKGTPVTLIRGKIITGFGSPDTTGSMIQEAITDPGPAQIKFEDIIHGNAVVNNLSGKKVVCDEIEGCSIDNSYLITVPFIGTTIDVGNFSLAGLSLILGLVDGFNPCAMWVLVMFLVLLSQIGDKKKMWQYAGLFIFAQALMYYFILIVWFAVWDFVKLDQIITPLIGLLALGSGLYFLYKFKTFKPVCSVTSFEEQQKIEAKASKLVNKPLTIAAAIGVIGLALSVNVFEFACSVGIPQTFTKILEINQLGWLKSQFFVFLYMLTYMFDDILVFGLALWSFEKISLTQKYSKWTTLIGGILMIILGAIMLLKPEWLVV